MLVKENLIRHFLKSEFWVFNPPETCITNFTRFPPYIQYYAVQFDEACQGHLNPFFRHDSHHQLFADFTWLRHGTNATSTVVGPSSVPMEQSSTRSTLYKLQKLENALRETGETGKSGTGSTVLRHYLTHTNTQIQMHKYKYTNTNAQIQIHKYKVVDLPLMPLYTFEGRSPIVARFNCVTSLVGWILTIVKFQKFLQTAITLSLGTEVVSNTKFSLKYFPDSIVIPIQCWTRFYELPLHFCQENCSLFDRCTFSTAATQWNEFSGQAGV